MPEYTQSQVEAIINDVQSRLDKQKKAVIAKQLEVDFMVQEIREIQAQLDEQKARLLAMPTIH